MKIYDITQELFSSSVYPGDTAPSMSPVLRIAGGDVCNLSDMNICLHNGTHIDAPFHFLADGKSAEQIDLYKCMGKARVAAFSGEIDEVCARQMLSDSPRRLLIKGKAEITCEAAGVFAESGLLLIGVEPQSVSNGKTAEVHKILLESEIVILEGIVLDEVPEGEYQLAALPLRLEGADGSPCRAVLIDE
ncbi:MAG: cyclase family protein [Ruminococcus sp.]|nr:cyclase family protein [Ruminococcus sp.]